MTTMSGGGLMLVLYTPLLQYEFPPATVTEVRTNSLFGMLANARRLDAPLAEAVGA